MINDSRNEQAKQLLNRARRIIDTPDKFVRGQFAATKNGSIVDQYSAKACKFCVMGALARATGGVLPYGGDVYERARRVMYQAAKEVFDESGPIAVSDELGFDAAHILLIEAAARLG